MKINKQIFLDDLPKLEKGVNIGGINWKKTIGYKVNFIYNNIEGQVEIIDYDGKFLYIKYLDYDTYKINFRSFKQGNLGKLLGIVTDKFKYTINESIKDNKRDLMIIDNEYRTFIDKRGYKNNEKWYKYKCNQCGWTEGWITEGHLKEGNGCPVCAGQKLVQGINDIPTVAPWLIPYFQGGIDEAKLYTKTGSGNINNPKGYIYPICPDCGKVKNNITKIGSIYLNNGFKCIHCSDGISFPEKFVFHFLRSLNIEFRIQYNPIWIKPKVYDFYIPNLNCIIETHGLQHYEEKGWKSSKTLKEEQENDKLKKELALANGIKEENYIVVDCRYSESSFIKQNISNSRLSEIFDLRKVDWNKIEGFALGSKVKEVCDLKKNNPNMSTKIIADIVGYHYSTISTWLKKGTKLGWCDYNAKEEREKVYNKNSKPIRCITTGDVFKSLSECEKLSLEVFGIKLNTSNLYKVCVGQIKQYKGLVFKYD